jgi:hypothetical protein
LQSITTPQKSRLADSGPEILGEVDPLPREKVPFGLTAEVAVRGGSGVDRLVEAEVRADAAGSEFAELVDAADRCLDGVVADGAGAVGVDIERQRLRNADRIGELDCAAFG